MIYEQAILEAMAKLNGGVIAIDGRAAAGKTTLSSNFASGTIIKMDDFFLPPELRTSERLAAPGGNIHYERFIDEVLPNLRTGQAFKYRKFDCSRMEYGDTIKIEPHPWRVVEGVYSCHPVFGDYMDISIFVDVEPGEQIARIYNRNNPAMAARYIDKWIPMEENYFNAYSIRQAADIVIINENGDHYVLPPRSNSRCAHSQ